MISIPIQKEEREREIDCDSTVFCVLTALILSSRHITLAKCILMEVQHLDYPKYLEKKVENEKNCTAVTNSMLRFYYTGEVSRLHYRACPELGW
jgi:hypothetical protein